MTVNTLAAKLIRDSAARRMRAADRLGEVGIAELDALRLFGGQDGLGPGADQCAFIRNGLAPSE